MKPNNWVAALCVYEPQTFSQRLAMNRWPGRARPRPHFRSSLHVDSRLFLCTCGRIPHLQQRSQNPIARYGTSDSKLITTCVEIGRFDELLRVSRGLRDRTSPSRYIVSRICSRAAIRSTIPDLKNMVPRDNFPGLPMKLDVKIDSPLMPCRSLETNENTPRAWPRYRASLHPRIVRRIRLLISFVLDRPQSFVAHGKEHSVGHARCHAAGPGG